MTKQTTDKIKDATTIVLTALVCPFALLFWKEIRIKLFGDKEKNVGTFGEVQLRVLLTPNGVQLQEIFRRFRFAQELYDKEGSS